MTKHTLPLKTLAMGLCGVLLGYTALVTSVIGGEDQLAVHGVQDSGTSTMDLTAPGTRVIYGKVEGLTETHIKVDSGAAGEMTPRYLEIEKIPGIEDDLQLGDRLQIVVGAQNIVQGYSKAND